ncbi:GSCOCG00012245001-RA-CDS [Cotesia congregata]|nr:GSCOCG00012245001-RA-CDS [Cotesia congregata]
MMFNPLDRHDVTDDVLFDKIILELDKLRDEGINIELSNCSVKVYFQLSLILGDNLGVHSLFGLTESFNAKYFCRFCKTERSNIQKITLENQCKLRDVNNYDNDLLQKIIFLILELKKNANKYSFKGFHIMENLSVDPMHDYLDGICPHDLALILQHFIYQEKLFNIEQLNCRIQGFNYGCNYNQNKPPEILVSHLRQTMRLAMSAAEMLAFVRNICLILGEFVDEDNEY